MSSPEEAQDHRAEEQFPFTAATAWHIHGRGLAQFTEEQVAVAPPWYLHAVGLARAVEARDVAIEVGDAAAWNFAQDVRTIIGLAVDRGASLTELAAEYPGGADFMDGPHIDAAISELAFRERPLGEESATLASLGDDPELRSFVGRDGAVWTQREPSGRYEKDTGPQALAYAERVAPDRAASWPTLTSGSTA